MLATMMSNGASVGDWLGTAGSSAQLCANRCSAMRKDSNLFTEARLRMAADDAAQALDEIVTVMDALGYPHGYGEACTFGTATGIGG